MALPLSLSLSLSLSRPLENHKREGPRFSVDRWITAMGFFGWVSVPVRGGGVHDGVV